MISRISKIRHGMLLLAATTVFVGPPAAQAQDGSLLMQPAQGPSAGLTLQNSSFLFRELPPEARVRELQINDIITVLVDIRHAVPQ